MHELSIAQSILDIVRQNVKEEDLIDVRNVKVKIGDFGGVVTDSLEFCFESLTIETPLEHSSLRIEHIPFRIQCWSCGAVTSNANGFAECARCGSGSIEVISGYELQVDEIELEDKSVVDT